MFCASQASTATANDECITPARAIDRHNPIIKDGRRSFTAPCSSGDDYIAPYRQITRVPPSPSPSGEGKIVQVEKGKRNNISLAKKSFGCVTVPKTPPGSTRYLLGSDSVSLPGSKRQDEIVVEEGEASEPKRGSGSVQEEEKKKKMSSGPDQVVVLRVSLHCNCRGCQDKVKKHLSKMQGVTSFNVDFASKKVTVTGDITPLDVLGCLSKVKSAQFWTPPPSSSLPMPNPQN